MLRDPVHGYLLESGVELPLMSAFTPPKDV